MTSNYINIRIADTIASCLRVNKKFKKYFKNLEEMEDKEKKLINVLCDIMYDIKYWYESDHHSYLL